MKIKLFVMDVDGTMTDGRFTIDEYGNETKTFNVKDGIAIKLLHDAGIKTAIITGHKSKVVENRAKQLSIDYYCESTDKIIALKDIISNASIALEEVAYIGDDLNDLAIFDLISNTGCPNDACDDIKRKSQYICKVKGGYGAVREYAEHIVNQYDKKGK